MLKDTLEYRKLMRMLKVKTPDNHTKTLLVRESKTVVELMEEVSVRVGIPNNNEYSLASSRELKSDNKSTIEMRNLAQMEAIKSSLFTEDEGKKE